MNKVNVVAVLDVLEQGRGAMEAQRIPADLRNFEPGGNHIGDGANAARDESQALVLTVFIAFFKKHLHAKANAQQRLPRFCLLYDHAIKSAFAKLFAEVRDEFDYIIGDECQDFSVAQRELILRCVKKNTRMFYVGDKNQCLYNFASASPESFDKLKSLPNTISLPLSISYRCPKNIVKFAQTLVPNIEHNENNKIDGEVKYNSKIEEINDGDMVLCRNNAPLMKLYTELIRNGKKCKIRGKDIGLNLKRIVKSYKQDKLNADLSKDGLFVRLYENLFSLRDKMIKKSGLDETTIMNDSAIVNKLDVINTLEILSEGINNSDELITKISDMFSDRKNVGISLSTIHKAKGLECNNVFIACPSLMPSKSANQKWEIEQENNLKYVAYTRAKSKLSFLNEEEFKDLTETNNNKLKEIERQVNKILGKEKAAEKAAAGRRSCQGCRSQGICRHEGRSAGRRGYGPRNRFRRERGSRG